MKHVMMVVGALGLVACASGTDYRADSAQVYNGMTRTQVVDLMGPPGNRSFRDTQEAYQYCDKDLFSDYVQITTVWLRDGSVFGLTTSTGFGPFGCRDAYTEIDWGQVPADVSIEVR